MFSTGDAPFHIPTKSAQSFQFPILIHLCQPKAIGVSSMPVGIPNLGCSEGNFIQCKQPPWDQAPLQGVKLSGGNTVLSLRWQLEAEGSWLM